MQEWALLFVCVVKILRVCGWLSGGVLLACFCV